MKNFAYTSFSDERLLYKAMACRAEYRLGALLLRRRCSIFVQWGIYMSGQVPIQHDHVVIGIGFCSINKVEESKNYTSFQHGCVWNFRMNKIVR